MRFVRKLKSGAFVLAFAGIGYAADCEDVARIVTSQIEEKPENVLIVVEDAMATHDKCACEIVKAAIVTSQANEKLVGEIVFTAVISSEKMAPTIAECAISVAPDSASQIRGALKRALSDGGDISAEPVGYYEDNTGSGGGKEVVSSKNPSYGKEPPPIAEPVEDPGFTFGRSPLDVRGIYLLAPSAGGFVERVEKEVIVKIKKRIMKVPRPPGGGGPVTPSNPAPNSP